MDAHLLEFAGMLVRWLHVVAGIAWIGSSFYFIWLDNSLEPPPPDSPEKEKGVAGELWAVHGGGFYNPQKYALAPARLPHNLHWFKWEAYTTWLSGSALLILVYWLRAGVMMVNPSAPISAGAAVAVGAGSMLGSWLLYDLLCRSPLGRRNGLLGIVVFLFLTGLGNVLCRCLDGRAAFIQVGAAIGSIMAANVFFAIIPGQRRMVAAMRSGQKPDPRDGLRGKQRSVHNNYFTLPVVFIMLSNHYSLTYANPQAWAVLATIGAAGVSIRHFFNRKHRGIYAWQYLGLGGVLLAATAWWTAPHLLPLPPLEGTADFARVRAIVGQRCITCHAAVPTFPGIAQPPAGVILATPEGVLQNAQRIYQQVIVTRIMPLGNATHMTDQERAVLAAWIAAGAKPQ